MADWSKLQSDLVWLIAKQLELYKDFVAFRGVCSWWRTVANEGIFTFPESPWLMLAEEKDSDTRSFFSLSKKGIVEKRMLPEAKGKRCWGSHGWLITFDIDLNINLLNPWTRLQIHLPHQRTFKGQNYWLTLTDLQKHYIAKAVLSSSPSSSSSSDYVVMVIHGNLFKLGFAKAGDKSWTTIETWFGMYSDILFYKGLFYAVNYNGLVFVCDVEGSNPTEARCVSRKPVGFMDCPSKIYLVESSGALLVVSRYISYPNADPNRGIYHEGDDDNDVWPDYEEDVVYETTLFKVFELDISNGKWKNLKSLGDRLLFLGHNSSVSFAASQYPQCMANCIYFTDDYSDYHLTHVNGGGMDMGIFNLENGSIRRHYMGDLCMSQLSPPMWVLPSL